MVRSFAAALAASISFSCSDKRIAICAINSSPFQRSMRNTLDRLSHSVQQCFTFFLFVIYIISKIFMKIKNRWKNNNPACKKNGRANCSPVPLINISFYFLSQSRENFCAPFYLTIIQNSLSRFVDRVLLSFTILNGTHFFESFTRFSSSSQIVLCFGDNQREQRS